MTDHCSGYTELAPCKTTSATETASLVFQHFYLRYGFVPVVISDRGTAFLAQYTQKLFELCSIKHICTTSWHPNLNGPAEQKMKMLTVGLRAFMAESKTHWETKLPAIQFSYNVTQIPTLGFSPFNLVFNRHPRTVVDTQILLNTQKADLPAFVETFLPSFEIVNKVLAENVEQNRATTQYYQNLKAKPHNIVSGSIVYKQIMPVGSKMMPRWTGPYKVLYLVGDNAVRLQNIYTGAEESPLVNVNYLKTAKDRRQLFHKYWSTQTRDQLENSSTDVAVHPIASDNSTDTSSSALPVNQALPTPTPIVQCSTDQNSLPVSPQVTLNVQPAEPSPAQSPVPVLAANSAVKDSFDDATHHSQTPITVNSNSQSNIKSILRRMKIGRAYRYRVALHDSDQEIWLKPHQIPFSMLFEYNRQAARNRQQRLRGQRSGFAQH
jgi:hypothetical protein